MKTKTNTLKLIAINFIAIFLFSCSDNLSREKAEKLIREKFQFPKSENRILYKWGDIYYNRKQFKEMINEGLWIYNSNRDALDVTEKGKKYVVSDLDDLHNLIEVRLATMEFGGVTGIVDKEFKAEVHYSKIRRVTPFGKIFNLKEDTINKEIIFTKYDDGWRIGE